MNIEFDRCIDFLTRMIEKYGDEIKIIVYEERIGGADQSIVAANEAKDTNDVCS